MEARLKAATVLKNETKKHIQGCKILVRRVCKLNIEISRLTNERRGFQILFFFTFWGGPYWWSGQQSLCRPSREAVHHQGRPHRLRGCPCFNSETAEPTLWIKICIWLLAFSPRRLPTLFYGCIDRHRWCTVYHWCRTMTERNVRHCIHFITLRVSLLV